MSKLTIAQWNIRGFYSQRPYLQHLIDKLKPSILCLQETHLKPNNSSFLSQYQYPPVRKDRDDSRKGGGVCIFIKKNIPYVTNDINSNLEVTSVKVFLENKTTTLCNIYIPPDHPNQNLRNSLDDIISQVTAPFIIVMDSNAHNPEWGSPNLDTRGRIISEWREDHSTIILNNGEPTYLSSSGNYTHIDLTFVSPDLASSFSWHVHYDNLNSDHFPIIFGNDDYYQEEAPLPRWKINKADWPAYQDTVKIPTDYLGTTPTEACNLVTESIIKAAESTVPKTSQQKYRPSAYWWNQNCTDKKRLKNRALTRYKNHKGDIQLWILYKEAKARFIKATQEAKKESWNRFLQGISSTANTGEVWNHVRKLRNKKTSTRIILKENDNIITKQNEIAEIFADQFAQRSSGISSCTAFNNHKALCEREEIIFEEDSTQLYNKEITIKELTSALSSCVSKSPGPDTLPYIFIQKLPTSQLYCLLKFYNHIFNSGYPDQWKLGTIVAIHKPNKVRTSPNSIDLSHLPTA